MYPYSCYACSIVYICKYCVCPHGLTGCWNKSIYYIKKYYVIRFREWGGREGGKNATIVYNDLTLSECTVVLIQSVTFKQVVDT